MIDKDSLIMKQNIYKRYPDGTIQGFIVSFDPYPTIGVKRTTVNKGTEHKYFYTVEEAQNEN